MSRYIRIELAKAYQKLKTEYIDFGSDDTEPSHILLLNQSTCELYIAEFQAGKNFLQEQYPKHDKNEKIEMTKEQWEEILIKYRKEMQEDLQKFSRQGLFESLVSINVYRDKIANYFNNYCVN